MTEMQTYTDKTAQTDLSIKTMRDATVISVTPARSTVDHMVMLPTLALLAMIDRTAPCAMRSYLRERSDLIDAPDESCSTLEDMLPANLAAEAARYRIDATPEADSSEDVDENPEPVITVTPEDLDAAEQLGRYVAEIRDAFARGLAR